MPVTVDHASLPVEGLGLRTVGQLLSHVTREKRLVVNLLIDGREPDYADFAALKQSRLTDHTLFVETADPGEVVLEALDEVERQMAEAGRLTTEAVALLQTNQPAGAMQKLSGCFTTWQHAQESIDKSAQLLRIDPADVTAGGQSLAAMMAEFGEQLRSIKRALEDRDYVALGDVLTYETPGTMAKWTAAIDALRDRV